ncbi:MAG TPA: glycosyltransferase [Thermoanaerobaculia bacterium]|nr:glycosyltransferase [Thermoanaerobaculia bacterium]
MSPPLRLIVAGMHRSGTSLVASLLAAWNVRMGDRLLPADGANPAGYFEDVDFLELDRRILIAGTPPEEGHRDWGWTESETFDGTQLAAYREEAAALILARDRAETPWGWKDPRTSMLLDFWDDVLDSNARYLLVYRQPWEVADSILRTGAGVWLTHPGWPARIWTHYNRRILDFHGRHADRSLLVSSNRLLRDPEAFAAMIRHRFDIDADAGTLATLRAKELFVSVPDDDPLPRLWHYTNRDAMQLLGALDDAADLGNERRWETGASKSSLRSATPPRLSVVIPCHDDGDYLIDAVASVERHAPAAELIVVDDGSTQPRTIEVLAALREAGHRVVEQPHAGLSAARNRGIAASAGEYLLPLDADNRLLPRFVAEAMAILDADQSAGVVYGDRREFGARSGNVSVPELELPRLLWSNYIDACAVVRRAVWNDVGGYDVALPIWEDWDFWLAAAARGWRFVRVAGPTFEYRVRPDSMHQRFLRRNDHPAMLARIYAKHRDLVSAHAAEILLAGHDERRQLFGHTESLRASRDAIQTEIDRLARGTHAQLAALHETVAARDAELASLKPPDTPAAPEPMLTEATPVFTIIARNYLAHARVLAASLARHNPAARLHVLLLDDPERSIPPEPSFELIHPDELPFDPPSEFYTMAAIYDVTELATAVKPWVFEHLFARGAAVAIYLDPDIEVFDSLGPLEPLAREHGIVLTPHLTEPLPRDDKRPDERDLLLAGIYNLGFLALSADAATTFLPWWRERLRRDCLNDPTRGLFVDQRWIDYAPALFEPRILKDPGYNVAYWNLSHRLLTRDDERAPHRILVNGQPLRFFHFSGFSPRTPHLLSKHQHASVRIRLSDQPLLAELCERYAAALEQAGVADCTFAYGFEQTAAGLLLDTRARRTLRRTYLDDEAGAHVPAFANPFSRNGADDVIERLLRPSPHGPGVPAYLGEIWSERPDLRVAFPRINSVDAKRFLDWVRTQGVREHEIPPQLIPREIPEVSTPATRAKSLSPGVNVYGYAFAESGTGQIVRSAVAALAAEGIPYSVVPFTRTISRQQREFRDLGAAAPTFDTNLICVNADQVPLFFESMGTQLLPGARNIGLWAWEVEDLPAAMAGNERYLDEVWGISEFTAATLARALTRPVRAFPLPVVVPQVKPRTRAELGMPDGFLFLFCFDFDSVFRRKNPLAAITAFQQAFRDRNDVVLYIKTTNAERHAAESEALRAAARGRANIVIRDAYVTSDEYFSMLDACDCYVSLHRSEGFGLTVAEAMALGKPVISTAYSSTLEFANDSNSFPVRTRIVEVGNDAPPYPPHSRWAEPDVAHAAEQMVRVYADRGEAAAMGERARADIETLHSPAARGPLLRRLLDQSRSTRDTLAVPVKTLLVAPPAEEFEAEALAVESLLGSPRANLPSRMQRLMNPLRRLVLRCIRVYWVQQLAIDRALLSAMRTLRRESHAALQREQSSAQERSGGELARLREELTKVSADIDTLHERIDAMAAVPPTPMRPKSLQETDRDPHRKSAKS